MANFQTNMSEKNHGNEGVPPKTSQKTTRNSQGMQNIWRKPTVHILGFIILRSTQHPDAIRVLQLQRLHKQPSTSGQGLTHHSTSEPTKFGGPLIRAIKQTHLSCSIRLISFRRGIQIIPSWWSYKLYTLHWVDFIDDPWPSRDYKNNDNS